MLRRTPLKKRSQRGIQKALDKKELLNKDRVFYLKIWEDRPHVCAFCKTYLGSEPRTYHFDHILEKEVFPEYRHEEKNIQLLCLNCHSNKTAGHVPEWFKKFVTNLKSELCQDTIIETQKQDDSLEEL